MCFSVDASQHRLNHKSLISPNFISGQTLSSGHLIAQLANCGDCYFDRDLRAADGTRLERSHAVVTVKGECGLAKIALKWMLAEAYANGLLLDKSRTDEVANAKMHKSLTIGWWLGEFVPKKHFDAKTGKTGLRLNLFRRRSIPNGALIHNSVKERTSYSPTLPPDAQFVGSSPLP
jgi:hypothetical protein